MKKYVSFFTKPLLVVVMLFCTTIQVAAVQSRVAFLIGNSNYKHAVPLRNPIRDVELLEKTLTDLDFKVSLHKDLSRNQIGRELSKFLKDNKNADLTLFYFAGHGMQYENQNFLVGVDAKLETEFDIESEALDLSKVVQLLKKSSKASLVFIDACRDNPLANQFYKTNFSQTRALMTRGLAPLKSAYNGAMITFSAAPGQVAFDGDEYSPFAKSLAKHLPSENVEVLSLMKRVIRDVKQSSDNKQIPLVSNDLTTEIYLKLGDGGAGSAITFKQEEAMFEAAMAIQSPRGWELYFKRFPEGFFRDMALIEHERIQMASLAVASGLDAKKIELGKPIKITREVAKKAEQDLGLTKEDAKLVQKALNDRGYNAGSVDGAIGNGTRKAIADFQLNVGLPSTGVVTASTASSLGIELQKVEISSVSLMSSTNARKFDPKTIELIEDDTRLIKALKHLTKYELIYGFFDSRIYIAVLTWGSDWNAAKKISTSVGGHLVTLGSKQENDFVYKLFSKDKRFLSSTANGQKNGPWIGLFQVKGSAEPRGGWKWVTNEPLNYQVWSKHQPNNYGGGEDFGQYHSFGSLEPNEEQRVIRWDDADIHSGVRGFIIEIE